MSKIFLILLFFISTIAYSQQDSRVRIDSGNGNEINVVQQGNDTSKKSNIAISHSDSNKLRISQVDQNVTISKSASNSFWYYANNTNTILGIIGSLITILGSSAYLFARSKSNKRK